MKLNKPILARLLIVAVPLLGLYGFAQMAFRANRLKQHPTDAGLGIAFLLLFMIPSLYIGCLIASRNCFYKWLIDVVDFVI